MQVQQEACLALCRLRLRHPCAMQLLGELLLDRANSKVMLKYVADPMNLMMMMILLKDNSRSIQFEAFHVFKVGKMAPLHLLCALCLLSEGADTMPMSLPQVFVANPNKPDAIVEILTSNKDKLLKYLGDFHTDKGTPLSVVCRASCLLSSFVLVACCHALCWGLSIQTTLTAYVAQRMSSSKRRKQSSSRRSQCYTRPQGSAAADTNFLRLIRIHGGSDLAA